MRDKLEVFIMVDTEYSGEIPGDFSLLSIGAVQCGSRPSQAVANSLYAARTFYVEIQPLPNAGVDAEAMAVNKLDLKNLARNGVIPHLAMTMFADWIHSFVPRELAYPVMVSDGMQDFMFVRWYFKHFGIPNPFAVPGYNPAGHGIDMKSMLFGKHPGLRISQTRRASVIERFPEYRSQYQRTHHALSDAIEQADRFEKMRG